MPVDQPCADYPDLFCFPATLQNMQSFQDNSFSWGGDLMSFSQVDDLYADLTHVSKMLVDHPCTDDPDLFCFLATLQNMQSFQESSFSWGDALYAV